MATQRGGRPLPDAQHMIESAAVGGGGGGGGGLQCLLAGAVLGSASEQRRISHHCQGIRREPSHLERVGLLTTQPVCQTSVSLAI